MTNKEKLSRNSIKLNRRVITFLFCILISVFFWFMMTLSKEYIMNSMVQVRYINFPVDKIVENELPEKVKIELRANGFSLLTYKFKQKDKTIVIDLKNIRSLQNGNQYYLLSSYQIDKISSKFSEDIKLLRIYPDSIFLNLNKKITKNVPVKANISTSFQYQYLAKDSIKLYPSFVAISGTADIVNKIKQLETVPVVLKNISKPISIKLKILKTKGLESVELSQSTVIAKENVIKYTESSVELPIEVENVPLGYVLKTFPDKVFVRYNVFYDDYEKINASQFRAIVDYKRIEAENGKLKVQLIKQPKEINAIKISPEKVEYIIRK